MTTDILTPEERQFVECVRVSLPVPMTQLHFAAWMSIIDRLALEMASLRQSTKSGHEEPNWQDDL